MLGEKTVKIVVINDPHLPDSMDYFLGSTKYKLIPIQPIQKSIERIRKVNPDIFVVDCSDLEKLLNICQNIRKYSGVPILVLSVNHKPELVERVLGAGADEFLIKPVSGSILKAYLNNLTRRARAENAAAITIVNGNDGKSQPSRLLVY